MTHLGRALRALKDATTNPDTGKKLSNTDLGVVADLSRFQMAKIVSGASGTERKVAKRLDAAYPHRGLLAAWELDSYPLASKRIAALEAENARLHRSSASPDTHELKALRAVLKQALDKLSTDERAQLAGAYRAANGTLLTDADFGLGPMTDTQAETERAIADTACVLRMLKEAGDSEVPPEVLLAAWRGALSGLVAQKVVDQRRRRYQDGDAGGRDAPPTGSASL